ncbi:MAG TPA: hypothetical protein VNG69_03680 [Casimicrobiaceae bacterium]|nr:hypothetical protein [Casimicrobiaceae bacterium]
MRAFLVLTATLLISTLVTAALSRFRTQLPADTPNARSLHRHAVPRGGGLAIWAGFAPAAWIAPPAVPGSWLIWLMCLVAVALISLVDDVRSLPAYVRLAVQVCAAGVVAMLLGGAQGPGALASVAGVALAIIWGSNLFNFMDGSDGLAATMGIAGFAAYAVAAALAGVEWVAFAAIAIASVPFLFANKPPARLFMGDVGAVPLGFLATSLGAAGIVQHWWPAWFPLLIFLPFLGDATLTLARRVARGERVWKAHRTHYYQRLNALGAGHRGTLAIYAASMIAAIVLALVCLRWRSDGGWIALSVAIAAQLIAFAAIDYHWSRRHRTTQ